MQSAMALDADRTVRLWKKGTRYFASVEGLAVFGTGNTSATAMAELDRRFAELQAFSTEAGLAPDTLVPGGRGEFLRWKSTLGKTAIVIVCIWLAMIPLSYALSTALERTVTNLNLHGGKQFWSDVEQGLYKLAEPSPDLTPDRQAKILAALRTVVERVQPYADAIRPVLGCTHPQ